MQPDPTFSQPFGHLSAAHGCRSLQIGGAKRTSTTDSQSKVGRRRFEGKKHFQILAGSTTFSGEPIIVVDEVGMKLDSLVELYVFLRFDSTFNRCLWKLKFEHGDLLVVQLDRDEQREKMSGKKYNR